MPQTMTKPVLMSLALAVLTGCAPFTVKYDYDARAHFEAFKTYDWYAASSKAKGQAAGVENPIMDRRVRNAVERELAAKGLKQQTTGEPDLLVTYYPVYNHRAMVTSTGFGGGWGYRPYGLGMGTSITEVHHYQEGSIVLELVDNKTNQLIWQAAAEGALSNLEDPQEAEEQVGKAVKALLTRFPPARAKRTN
jgi:hypothetical protein